MDKLSEIYPWPNTCESDYLGVLPDVESAEPLMTKVEFNIDDVLAGEVFVTASGQKETLADRLAARLPPCGRL